METYNYNEALSILTDWCISEGFKDIDLKYSGTSQVDWVINTINEPNSIKIYIKYNDEIKTYVLLHELGHHQLRKNWNNFNRVLPVSANAELNYYKNNKNKYLRRLNYTVSCMEEEFKAWDEGFKLGKKLLIKIDLDNWIKIKTTCLISYMRFYTAKK